MTRTAKRYLANPSMTPLEAIRLPRLLFRLPGVYRPQADTHLLASALTAESVPAGARVLDMCAGTGAMALVAAMRGWAQVTAIDISRRAVLSTRLNAWHRGLPIRARRVSFMDLRGGAERFDLVLANPPYVPCAATATPTGRARCWDAGPDGRSLLDPLCAIAPQLLAPSGRLLLVQSDVSGVDATLEQLGAAGLRVRVMARRRVPFGPIMGARADFLEAARLIDPGRRYEDLVVIRADRS
jgi:release factor glutamine methyltransferase